MASKIYPSVKPENGGAEREANQQVAWSPLPPQKKKKEKNAIQKAVERNKKLEDLINQM